MNDIAWGLIQRDLFWCLVIAVIILVLATIQTFVDWHRKQEEEAAEHYRREKLREALRKAGGNDL